MSSIAAAPTRVRSSPAPPSISQRLPRQRAERPARGLVPDGAEPWLAEGRHRAVDDDLADVQRAEQVRDRVAERACRRLGRRPARPDPRRPPARRAPRGRAARPRAGRRPPGSPGALATVSRQPRRPQWQSAPSGSTTMWPISPAPRRSPSNSSPSRTSPAPMPLPDVDRDEVRRPAASAEQVRRDGGGPASLATIVGRPYRARRMSPRRRSPSDRLSAQRIVPSRSTMPGVPTLMPRICWCSPARISSIGP